MSAKNISKNSSGINNQIGFTLIELSVALSLCIIIAYVTGSIYMQSVQVHRRQQRVMQIERSLLNTHHSLRQSLTTFPGRNLGVLNKQFSVPTLPLAGTTTNPATDKPQPIELALVTPYKVNGNDAFMVVYTDAKLPRLTIIQDTTAIGDIGTARVPLPFNSVIRFSNVPGKNNEDKNDKNNSDFGTIEQKIPSPTPSPIPTPGASPSPTPTKIPSGTGTTVLPPSVPFEQTLTGLPYYATTQLYSTGDLMLLVGLPTGKTFKLDASKNTESFSRVVKLTQISQPRNPNIGVGPLNQRYIDFSYDLCINGDCDSNKLPGVSNVANSTTTFRQGAILVPIKIACFYLKKDEFGSRLIRNDGGVILPANDGTFQVQGGIETMLGETDSIKVRYFLDNNTVEQTPNNPLVPWLNQVKAVDISLVKSAPQVQGTEDLTRTINLNFPLVIRHLE
ncbi:MAG: hypothetical protein FD167_851 [bacterium]|nr:MAG: hypothetical protein FD167_851 [bacterium]